MIGFTITAKVAIKSAWAGFVVMIVELLPWSEVKYPAAV